MQFRLFMQDNQTERIFTNICLKFLRQENMVVSLKEI